MNEDTIAAISTPLGEAGIGIVRLSGERALSIAGQIFKAGHTRQRPSQFPSYTTHYGYIHDNDKVIDEVILTVMRAPKTYTREDIVEINAHSGIVPLRKILELVLQKGVRLAQPGEFTRRAFLHGRIDLAQAEAVVDIVRAKTELSLKAAMEQLKGGLSRKIKKIRKKLIEIIGQLEAGIDFPEEEIEEISLKELKKKIREIQKEMGNLICSFTQGKVLREGINTAIIGRANVGKSTLFNALLKENRAMVTPIPGTTRDTLEELINVKGVPLRIIDTAGIQGDNDLDSFLDRPASLSPSEYLRREAIKRARSALKKAELILLVLDGSACLTREDKDLFEEVKGKKVIVLINKADLPAKIKGAEIKKVWEGSQAKKIIDISALKEINLDKVENAIEDLVWKGAVAITDAALVTNVRHQQILIQAEKSIKEAGQAMDKELSEEFIVNDLRQALNQLGEITGETFTEKILDNIFSRFCIGK